METIKTAISIQKPLFDEAENLARKMKISRSRLFVLALEDYIGHQRNRELFAQVNTAYADNPDLGDRTLHRKVRRSHRRIVEGEW